MAPVGKKWAGVCMLCGEELFVPAHVFCVEDAPEVFIRGTNTHDCEPGRILTHHGSDAFELWVAAQQPGTFVSVDELMAELEKFEQELKP